MLEAFDIYARKESLIRELFPQFDPVIPYYILIPSPDDCR